MGLILIKKIKKVIKHRKKINKLLWSNKMIINYKILDFHRYKNMDWEDLKRRIRK